MTSTQRSESANHMLKNYVPPGCPMNLFVKQYHKFQFDREQEEGFQEKRSRLGGVVLRANIPIEKHASKIYTRTMFEMFGSFLYSSGAYMVEEVIPKLKYIAKHNNAEKREKYRKSVYEIEVSGDGLVYTCECGLFEHMGMVCCHILKVMSSIGLQKIPAHHIIKRWTMDARDILPEHLKHYQKDQGRIETPTFRHTSLYSALELVMLGDTNVEAYDVVMQCIADAKLKVQPLCLNKDGMSVIEKTTSITKNQTGSYARGSCSQKQQADAVQLSGNWKKGKNKATVSECSTVNGDDNGMECSSESQTDVFSPDRSHCDLNAPPPKRLRGRPSTSREKTPYENKDKRSRFCTICRGKGHNALHAQCAETRR